MARPPPKSNSCMVCGIISVVLIILAIVGGVLAYIYWDEISASLSGDDSADSPGSRSGNSLPLTGTKRSRTHNSDGTKNVLQDNYDIKVKDPAKRRKIHTKDQEEKYKGDDAKALQDGEARSADKNHKDHSAGTHMQVQRKKYGRKATAADKKKYGETGDALIFSKEEDDKLMANVKKESLKGKRRRLLSRDFDRLCELLKSQDL